MRKKTQKQKNKEKADKWFSLFIRLKYSDWRGYCRCYTCDRVYHYKSIQCGHFVSRASSTLRFDERNARPQCYGCNVAKSGNYIEYTRRMQREIGIEGVEKLIALGKDPHQFSEEELEIIANKYKRLAEEIMVCS